MTAVSVEKTSKQNTAKDGMKWKTMLKMISVSFVIIKHILRNYLNVMWRNVILRKGRPSCTSVNSAQTFHQNIKRS